MRMDFEDRLLDYVESLDIDIPVYTDSNDVDTSLSVVRMPGSRTIMEYYDGTKEKQYKFFIQLKCDQTERVRAMEALDIIKEMIDEVEDIPSHNNSYEYGQTIVSNEPYYMAQDTAGGLFFRFSIDTELTIFKEEQI